MHRHGVFAVGGDGQGTVERFDLASEEWRLAGGPSLSEFLRIEGVRAELEVQGVAMDSWQFASL